jgi:PAS domain S-box-containing protein
LSSPDPARHSFALQADLSEAGRARQIVGHLAALSGFSEERRFDIQVACSEACANAIEHSPLDSEVLLEVLIYPDRLEVTVEGRGQFEVPAVAARERTHRGLGLPLMAKLSDHLALYSGPQGGTQVALAFYRPGFQDANREDVTPPSILALLEENELVAAITGTAPVGLYVLDPGLRFRWANTAYRAFLEEPYRSEPLDGVFVGEAVPGSEKMGSLEILRTVSLTGERAFFPEYEFVGFARGVTYWRWEILPLRYDRLEPPYDVLVVISETTEQVLQRQSITALAAETAQRAGQLQGVLDASAVAIWVAHDPDCRVITGNLYADQMVMGVAAGGNISRSAVPGTAAVAYTVWRDGRELGAEELPAQLAARTAEPVFDQEFELRFSDGRVVHMLANAVPLFDAEGKVAGSVTAALDVTERKRAEEALKEAEQALHLAERASRAGSWDWDIPAGTIKWDDELYAAFGLDPAEGEASFETWGRMLHPDDAEAATARIEAALRDHTALASEYRVTLPDASEHWIYAAGEGIYDENGSPVRMIGICVDITESKQAEMRLLRLNRILQALSESNQALVLATDESAYLDEACRLIVEDCGYAMVWIGYAEDDEAKSVRPVVSAGFEDGYLETLAISWADTERGLGPTGTAVRTGVPTLCRSMRTDPCVEPWRDGALARGYAASIALPLVAGERPFGVISIYSDEPDPFSEEEVRLLADLARDVARGITILRLRAAEVRAEEERRRLLRQEEELAAAARDIVQRKSAEEAANRASRYNRSLLEAALDPLVTFGPDGKITDVNEATVAVTGRTRSELIGTDFSDYFTDPEAARLGYVEAFAEGSVTDYPLTVRAQDGRLTDVLYNASVYRDDEGRVLGVFAAARDITALKQLEEQRIIVNQLQQALFDIPRQAKGVTFGHVYRSATQQAQVGGDFYDVFEAKGGRIAILIGDVSGHGLEAARIATLSKDVVHAFVHQFRRPHLVLRGANRLLVEKKLPGFVSAFLAFLDPRDGTLVYSSAGHPPPLVCGGGRTEFLQPGGLPLGVFAEAKYREESLLLLYTDGITEARRDGDLYGEERLARAVVRVCGHRVDELPALLLDDALEFSGGTLRDDVALLAVNYRGAMAQKAGL